MFLDLITRTLRKQQHEKSEWHGHKKPVLISILKRAAKSAQVELLLKVHISSDVCLA
jgi:hypothetical protein